MTKQPATTRHAALITFKEGVSEAEIAKAMNLIKHVLDLPTEVTEAGHHHKVPFAWRHLIKKYDPQYGEPCFYIP